MYLKRSHHGGSSHVWNSHIWSRNLWGRSCKYSLSFLNASANGLRIPSQRHKSTGEYKKNELFRPAFVVRPAPHLRMGQKYFGSRFFLIWEADLIAGLPTSCFTTIASNCRVDRLSVRGCCKCWLDSGRHAFIESPIEVGNWGVTLIWGVVGGEKISVLLSTVENEKETSFGSAKYKESTSLKCWGIVRWVPSPSI